MLMEDDMQGISKKSWAIIITDFNTPVLRQPSLDLEWSAVVSDHNPYGGKGEERKRLMPMSVAATCSRSLVSMQPYTPFFISVPILLLLLFFCTYFCAWVGGTSLSNSCGGFWALSCDMHWFQVGSLLNSFCCEI
eukprot:TRINITY_DN1288_c0_g1_i3.p1 TRINITY_DN1288_c0_g1~~TRINITY_DN1288_c0_g1_i3.p1  ORF type:complete len:135 (-),score=14.78 TRINITY_DN1288_c0_g1_i3:193-597(-)